MRIGGQIRVRRRGRILARVGPQAWWRGCFAVRDPVWNLIETGVGSMVQARTARRASGRFRGSMVFWSRDDDDNMLDELDR